MRMAVWTKSHPVRSRSRGVSGALWWFVAFVLGGCSNPLHLRSGNDGGASGAVTPGTGCPSSEVTCAGTCVDTQTDDTNCGGCGTLCSAASPSTAQCTGGRCLVTLAAGQPSPSGIAVGATGVCWLNRWTGEDYRIGSVMRIPLGGGVPIMLASGQSQPDGITVDATYVYWTNAGMTDGVGTVMKMPLAGGAPIALASAQSSPGGITVDETNVYWADAGTASALFDDGSVMMVPRDGDTPTALAIGGETIGAVADAASAYWTNVNDFVPGECPRTQPA